MFAAHNQLHMNGFSDVVNLLSISPGTALHAGVMTLNTKAQRPLEAR